MKKFPALTVYTGLKVFWHCHIESLLHESVSKKHSLTMILLPNERTLKDKNVIKKHMQCSK